MRGERSFLFAAVIMVCIVLLPIVGYVLISLWPQRVLLSWLLLGLVTLVILVKLGLWVIKARTIAKVRLSEEELRQGRLYAHERLVEVERRYNGEEITQQRREVMDEPYILQPYRYPTRQKAFDPHTTSDTPYYGLKPLNINSYDWEEDN